MIDNNIKDFDNQFFRMVSIALAKTMSKSIRWINYFSPDDNSPTGRKRILMPFYTSLTGDERFVLDLFVDDVVDKRVMMNTDQHQRGTITFTGFNTRSDELANPNQYLSKSVDINGKVRKIISKVKAVPISVNFDIEIQIATENEIDKCSQKILDMLFNYFFFNLDYYGLKIDAVLSLPDNQTIDIPSRETTMDSERKKSIKFPLEIKTYYPIFKITSDDLIVCDNDNDIDWDYLGIQQPTEDYLQTLKNYNAAFGQMGIKGGVSGSTEKEGLTEIKRVYWNNYYHALDSYEMVTKQRDTNPNPKNWNKEDRLIDPDKK